MGGLGDWLDGVTDGLVLGDVVISGVVEGVLDGLVLELGLVATVRFMTHGFTGAAVGLLPMRNMPTMLDETNERPARAPKA